MSRKVTFHKIILLCTALLILCNGSAYAGTEFVTVIKILDNDDKGIIERNNGETWMIEKGVGALSFWRFEGKQVLIKSSGIFCGVGSKLILPDLGQEARIWDAELIDMRSRPAPSSGTMSDSDITKLALVMLGFYDPESQDGNKSDAVNALKAFQKKHELETTGKICIDTLIELAGAVNSKKPTTEETLALSGLLLNAAKRIMSPAPKRAVPRPGRSAGTSAVTIESYLSGEFEGWEGETVVTLSNGQVWQQVEYYYHYHYAFMPKVTIFQSGGGYKMLVEGVPKAVGVIQVR